MEGGGSIKLDVAGIELHGGIHTMQIETSREISGCGVERFNRRGTHTTDERTGQAVYAYKVNLNKRRFGGTCGYIDSWKEFIVTFEKLLSDNDAVCERIRRVDYRVDSYCHDYRTLYQLNYAAALAFAHLYGWNMGRFWSGESIKAESQRERRCFVVYDKAKQTAGKDITKTRLEFRNLATDFTDVGQIERCGRAWLGGFFTMSGNVAGRGRVCFEFVQSEHNRRLVEEWAAWKKERGTASAVDFLARNRSKLLTAKQCEALCLRIGCAPRVSYHYKSRAGLSYIEKDEFVSYLSAIGGALSRFFAT